MSVDDLIGRIEKEKAQETISPAPSVPMSGVDSLIDRVSAEKAMDDQIARDKVLAAGGNPLEAVRDVGGGILSSFARLPEDLSNIARTVTGDADWARSMAETTGGWSEAARQKLLSETALAQQRIIARALQDPNVDVADLMKIVAENKQGAAAQGAESVGSFLIPTGAAVGSVKGLNAAVKAVNAAKTLTAAQKAKIGTGVVTGTNALMNAADTFTNDEIENLPLDRRYQGAALSGLASLVAGKLLDGGAEGAVARAILGTGGGKAGSSAAANFVRGAVKGGAKEFGQEGVEEGGNAGGVQLAQRRFDSNEILKQGAYGGTLGALIGGPTGGITGLKTAPQESQADIKPAMDSLSAIVNRAVAEAEANKPAEEEIKKPDAKLPEVKDTTMGAAKDVGAAQVLPGSDQVVRLQNRDRSTPSSVNQMAKIGGNLDYGRLSPGRDFGNGAPVVSFGNVPEEQKGRTDYAAYNDGQRVPVQYAVVDASTILTSNDSSGNVISEYRTAGPDRMRAIAGNGRIAGVQLAYRNGKAEKYRQEMIEDAANFGVDPAVIERIPNPVLVRIMPSDQIRQDVGSASNTSSNLGLSIVEQANDDAANINFDVLEFDANGAPTEETVRKFVGQFDNAAAASMTDAAGHVNQQGMQRFHAALFKKAYGSDQLTSLYAETLDSEAKNILNGMASAAGNMFNLEGLGDLDIRPIVADAAEMVVNARRAGKTVSEYLQQGTMGQSADAAVVARMFDAYSRSGKEIGRVLNQAAKNALDAASGQGAMFTDTNPNPTDRAGILNQIGEETNAKLTKPQNKSKPQEVANPAGTAPAAENVQRQPADGTGEGGNQGAVEQQARADGWDGGPAVSERADVNPETQNVDRTDGQSGLKYSKKRSKDEPMPRYKTRNMSNLTETEKEVIEEYFDHVGPKEAARIRDNIARLEYFTLPDGTKKRTPWGHLAIEAIFLRQAMRDLMSGRKPRAESMLDDGGMGNAIKAIKGGLTAIKRRLAVNGLLGNIEKCDYAVNSSFLNCNPSKACAYYCYAAEGRGGIPLTMVKSELTEYVVQHDPEWVAEQAVKEFTSMETVAKRDVGKSEKNLIGDTQVALRLFEKGDGNENWLPVIKALNDRGVRVHVFSKRPEFLRKVPDMNLRLLSVDSTNIEVADQNQDLKLAFVYEGEKHIPVLRKLFERGQIGVVLPVKLNGEYMSKEAVGKLKESIPGVGHNVCPIDAGRVKIGEFTCSNCDKFGCNGCYYSKDKSTTTEAVLAAMDEHFRRISKLEGLSPMEQAKILRDEAQRITEIIGKVVRGENVTDAEIERAGISLEQIKRYREPSSSGTGSSSKIRPDGIAFLADEVGKRIRAESEIFERGRPDQQNRVYAGEAGDEPGGGARRSAPKPVRVWGRTGRTGGDQGRNQGAGSNSGLKLSVNPRTGKQDIRLSIAYHGSPYVFDTFLTDHIGSGEGAQAHGWGLYFAKNRDVAEGYRDTLSDANAEDVVLSAINDFLDEKSAPFGGTVDPGEFALIYDLISQNRLPDEFEIDDYVVGVMTKDEIMEALGNPSVEEARLMSDVFSFIETDADRYSSVQKLLMGAKRLGPDVYKFFKDVIYAGKEYQGRAGRTFKVRIPDKDVMIRENAKFKDQPEIVQNAVRKILNPSGMGEVENLYSLIKSFGPECDRLSELTREYAKIEDEYKWGDDYDPDEHAVLNEKQEEVEKEILSEIKKIGADKISDIVAEIDYGIYGRSKIETKQDVLKAFDGGITATNAFWFSSPADRAARIDRDAKSEGDPLEKEGGKDLLRLVEKKTGSPKAAAEALNAEGVQGISYRGGLDGECYVVFNDKAIEILDFWSKNGGETGQQQSGSTVESISGVLESDPEIGEDFARLRDSGKVVVVQSADEIPGIDANYSKRHEGTGFVVDDGSATKNNSAGKIATVSFKVSKDETVVGDVVIPVGWHSYTEKHRGRGAKHLTANAVAYPSRDRYSDLQNKTESGIRSVVDVLRTAREVYIVPDGSTYVFCSRSLGRAVVTRYQGGQFRVVTELPIGVRPENRWGNNRVSFSGARLVPEIGDSATLTPEARTQATETDGLPEDELNGETYIDVDYTAEVTEGLRNSGQIKYSDDGSIQGAYDPNTGVVYLVAGNLTEDSARGVFLHEVGVHMAYSAREDMRPLTLQARNMINNGFKNGDARARRVKQRLVDAGIIERVEDDIPASEAEEAMAYLVEEAANSDARHPFRRWFDKLVAAIKQWLNKHGFNIELNADDFLEIALGNAAALSRSGDAVNSGLKYSRRGNGNPPLPGSTPPVPTGGKKPLRQRIKDGVKDVVSGPFFISKDALGRRQWAFGDRVYTKLGEFTTGAMQQFLDASNNLAPASKELRMQMRKMSAAVENAIGRGSDFAKKAAVLSPSERELISDFIEQELKPGVVPPQSVVDIASGMQQALEVQADEAVRLGMLSKESRERYRGRYLPRFYANETPEQERSFFSRIFGRAAALRGMQGSHLKGRGKFSQATAKSIGQWVQLGWEVRDERFEWKNGKLVAKQPAFAGLENSDESVNIWRDWTKTEREQMGEERDGVYRFAMGYMEMQKDLAIGRLFMAISANPEWCSSTPQEGFVHVPKTEIEGTGGVLKYGALSGKYVDKTVLSHIQHIEQEQSAFMKAYKQAMAIWKEGKTAMNPVSHMNNTIGNMLAAHFAGVNMWDGATYTKAIRSLIRAETDKHYREAKEAGLFSGSFTKTEMLEALQEMPEFKKKLQAEQGAFKNAADIFMNVATFGMRNKLRNAYEFEDTVFKMAIYRMCRDKGLSPEEAVDYAHQYVFVYDTLPAGARKLRDTMFPFFAWTYQAIPMVAKTALRYPHRFLLPAAVCYAINTMSFMAATGDDDDDWMTRWKKAQELEKSERGLLPKYMEGSSSMFTPKFLRLGIDDATGMPRYMNISYMIPGGNFLDADNQMGGIPWPDMFMPNHPAVNAFMTLMANIDMFSGQEVVKKTDDTQERLAKWTNYAWRQLSPAIAVGNYHWTRVMNGIAAETGTTIGAGTPFEYTGIDRYGNPMTLDMAMKNLVGIKVRALDYDTDFERIMRGIRSETDRIKSGVSQAYRSANVGAISREAAEGIRDKAIEKTDRLREEAKTLRENRDAIRRLTGK